MSRTRCLPMILPIIVVVLYCSQSLVSAPAPPPDSARLTLEARIITDSAGCPTAVDLYLVSTADSIQGLQIALGWDRSDYARFAAAPLPPPTKDTTRDTTLTRLLPKGAGSISVDPSGGLLADWEYVEGRSDNGANAMIIAIPALLTRRAGPILPGATGRLVRLPVIRSSPADVPGSDSATIWFDRRQTHVSDPNGRLITEVTFRDGVVFGPCVRERPVKR